jgi:phage terminase large subunit
MRMELNLNRVLNYKHQELFQSTAPELCIRGGKNAGKTYSIADKILLQPRLQPGKNLKAIVVRKTLPRIKASVLEILQKRAEAQKIEFRLNKGDYVAQVGGLKILFLSMENKDDHEKARSVTDVDFVWMNEATEMREIDYDMLRLVIRGGESSFSQLFLDFNPIGKTSWVYKRFFENKNGSNGMQKLHYTVYDNPWAREDEIEKLKSYKHINKNLYDINFLGQWGELEGVIYDWGEPVDVEAIPESLDETFYGLDFGYSVDPAALVRIYRKADEFWVEEVVYEKGLTNQALASLMRKRGVKEFADIYADSAEPKSIDELCREGFNVKPCEKGADSVRAGIDYLQSLKIHIIDGSENMSREQRSYVRKMDKDGNYLPAPVDFDNHAMDAIRYGIYTHCKKKQFGFGVM